MAYNILKTDGDLLVTIADGLSDTSQSSITLFGKNYTGYGPQLNENLVHMLENFAFSSAPAGALTGQLWWDTTNKLLKIRKDDAWKVIGGPTPSPSAPTSDTAGDLWWDTTNKQLKVFNGSDWLLTGPAYTLAQGLSGQVVETVAGATDGLNHTVVKFYLGGTVVAVLSKDATFDINSIPNFTSLRPGVNLPTGASEYVGNAENALSLGNVVAANYLRSDIENDVDYPINIKNDSGVTVGLDDDVTLKVQATNAVVQNNIEGGNINLSVKIGGVPSLALSVSGTDGRVTVSQAPNSSTGIANKEYVDTSIQTAIDAVKDGPPVALSTLNALAAAIGDDAAFFTTNANAHNLLAPKANPTFTGSPLAPTASADTNTTQIATTAFVNNRLTALASQQLTVATLTASTAITTLSNGSVDIGSVGYPFGTVYAISTTATQADLAENYVANQNLEPGTVVDFGGAYEVCKSIVDSSSRVAGVISTNPAYLMNSACQGEFVVAVALQGRCPVKVTGKIFPGALLVSAGNGHARAEENPKVGSVIGKAIGSFDGESGIIEVAVGRC